eukprot:COSAG05_NODE_701_length_7861_cov_46.560423_5_plen_185_part_00
MVATGSPFAPVEYASADGTSKLFIPSQCNNMCRLYLLRALNLTAAFVCVSKCQPPKECDSPYDSDYFLFFRFFSDSTTTTAATATTIIITVATCIEWHRYVFPGIGLAASVAGARMITDRMLYCAAVAVTECMSDDEVMEGRTFPAVERWVLDVFPYTPECVPRNCRKISVIGMLYFCFLFSLF